MNAGSSEPAGDGSQQLQERRQCTARAFTNCSITTESWGCAVMAQNILGTVEYNRLEPAISRHWQWGLSDGWAYAFV